MYTNTQILCYIICVYAYMCMHIYTYMCICVHIFINGYLTLWTPLLIINDNGSQCLSIDCIYGLDVAGSSTHYLI